MMYSDGREAFHEANMGPSLRGTPNSVGIFYLGEAGLGEVGVSNPVT